MVREELRFTPRGERLDWGAVAVGLDRVGQLTGDGVRVAVVDTGVDPSHPDLHVTGGVNLVDSEPLDEWADDYGHGTFVAGIIAAQANAFGVRGVSPGLSSTSFASESLTPGPVSTSTKPSAWTWSRRYVGVSTNGWTSST
jgi:subtilisin family serine protease